MSGAGIASKSAAPPSSPWASTSEQFGVHAAVVAFSPVSEPRALGSSTAESILRTYHTDAAPPPISSGASRQRRDSGGGRGPRGWGVRRAGDGGDQGAGRGGVGAGGRRYGEGQGGTRQRGEMDRNWWEVDVEAVGEEILVFLSALEMIWAEVEDRIDAMATERLPLPWKEKKLQ
jgi:pheromone receptor transcription factor